MYFLQSFLYLLNILVLLTSPIGSEEIFDKKRDEEGKNYFYEISTERSDLDFESRSYLRTSEKETTRSKIINSDPITFPHSETEYYDTHFTPTASYPYYSTSSPHDLYLIPKIYDSNQNVSQQRIKKHPIPLKVLKNLAQEKDVYKLFEKYVSNVKLEEKNGQKYVVNLRGDPIGPVVLAPTIDGEPIIEKGKSKLSILTNRNSLPTSRDRPGGPERIAAAQKVIKPAICEPELKIVEVPLPNDPGIVLFPKCVRVERCGGCCGSDLLTCEPVRTKSNEIQVQRLVYDDRTERLEFNGTDTVTIMTHTECRCNCRIKASDCSLRHEYKFEDCNCACRNSREQEICLTKPFKLWDSSICQCVCREIKLCPSGHSFNLDSCECDPNPETLRGNSQRNRRDKNKLEQFRKRN